MMMIWTRLIWMIALTILIFFGIFKKYVFAYDGCAVPKNDVEENLTYNTDMWMCGDQCL